MDLDHLSAMQIVALCILVAVLAYGLAHHFAAKKVDGAVDAAKNLFHRVEKRVEDYTDEEVVKLTTAFAERLAETSDQAKVKADADAVLARRAALLAKVQAAVAAAKPGA
jgi:uncharacterized protein YabE (DUF348 family)